MSRAAVLLVAATTAFTAAACTPPEVACPAIAAAPAVTVVVEQDYAPHIRSLYLKACQDGTCTEGPLELQPGFVSIGEECHHDAAPDAVCSATSSPDGTLHGMLMLDALTESPVAITLTGETQDGTELPALTSTINPTVSTPFGEQCGRFISASARLDAAGLTQGSPNPDRTSPPT